MPAVVGKPVVDDGRPISEVAARFQVSRPTVKRCADHYRASESLQDRSSRPRTAPHGTGAGRTTPSSTSRRRCPSNCSITRTPGPSKAHADLADLRNADVPRPQPDAAALSS
ncbi:helix-turn-helix domain-containing protein [Streptomyces laurentii]